MQSILISKVFLIQYVLSIDAKIPVIQSKKIDNAKGGIGKV